MVKTFTGIELVRIPAGLFWMGSPDTDLHAIQDERPYHQVLLGRPYLLGKYPVTVGQFRQFVEETGHCTEAEGAAKGAAGLDLAAGKVQWNADFQWRRPAFPQTDRHPVIHVSWNDAVAFCRWLSGREGQPFRLPTEAEWENACRAGGAGRFGESDEETALRRIANVADAALRKKYPKAQNAVAWNDGYSFTSPVGQFRPNAFGLYDMLGNVWEWCMDWYAADYYSSSPEVDPPGPDSGTHRVLRGGCWYTGVIQARCARRFGFEPHVRSDCMGFRVAVEDNAAGT